MGAEDFKVSGVSTLAAGDAHEIVLGVPGATLVDSYASGPWRIEVRDEQHVFEVEIWVRDGGSSATFSMTVCHPNAALRRFIAFVSEMVSRLDLRSISIMEDLPGRVIGDFEAGDLDGLADAVEAAFLLKRNLWRADFGSEEAAVTSREALRRFVLREP